MNLNLNQQISLPNQQVEFSKGHSDTYAFPSEAYQNPSLLCPIHREDRQFPCRTHCGNRCKSLGDEGRLWGEYVPWQWKEREQCICEERDSLT